jgi:hypothetical protein
MPLPVLFDENPNFTMIMHLFCHQNKQKVMEVGVRTFKQHFGMFQVGT